MLDQPSDATRRRRSGAQPADWRLGGRSVEGWREMLLAWSLVSLGTAVLLGFAIVRLWPAASWSSTASTAVLWIGMLIPAALAFSRSRPAGLLRFRWVDALFGVVLGIALRTIQGWLSTDAAFPRLPALGGAVPASWWWSEALPAGVVAPVVEEVFFRAVVLIALYTTLRGALGTVGAGVIAGIASAALFVSLHALGGALTADALISLGAVGLTCAALVLLTGRLWAAVIVHVVYNSTYLLLGLIGTLAG